MRWLVGVAVLLLVGACSGDDDLDATPAPPGFAEDVAAATAAAGELALEGEVAVAGATLATVDGTVDVGRDTATAVTSAPTADGDVVRFESIYADGRMSERRLGAPDEPSPVSSSGGPLLLPDDDTIDGSRDLRTAIRSSLTLVPLRRADIDGAPDNASCYSGSTSGNRPEHIEVCVDGDLVLRLLRTMRETPEGLVGVTTMRLA